MENEWQIDEAEQGTGVLGDETEEKHDCIHLIVIWTEIANNELDLFEYTRLLCTLSLSLPPSLARFLFSV